MDRKFDNGLLLTLSSDEKDKTFTKNCLEIFALSSHVYFTLTMGYTVYFVFRKESKILEKRFRDFFSSFFFAFFQLTFKNAPFYHISNLFSGFCVSSKIGIKKNTGNFLHKIAKRVAYSI